VVNDVGLLSLLSKGHAMTNEKTNTAINVENGWCRYLVQVLLLLVLLFFPNERSVFMINDTIFVEDHLSNVFLKN